MSIAYIICQDNIKSNDPRTTSLKQLVSDSGTPVNVVEIDVPQELKYPASLTKDEMKEIYRFIWCLNDARKSHPNSHILLLRNDSISNVSSSELKEILGKIAETDYDLSYLSKWNDACEKYDFDKASKVGNSILLKSYSPNGTQALAVSPRCRDKLLGLISLGNNQKIQDYTVGLSSFFNNLIESSSLDALAIVPNAFDAKVDGINDIHKLNQCATQSEGSMNWVIVGVGLLGLLIIIAIIILFKKNAVAN